MAAPKKMTAAEARIKAEADAQYRSKIFKELCKHVAQGYSIDCFALLSDVTISKYLKLYPKEFIEEELKDAMREGKQSWETIGRRQATGDCLGNSRSWYYNMANRYGWRDKIDIEAEHKGSVSVQVVNYCSRKASTPTCEQD